MSEPIRLSRRVKSVSIHSVVRVRKPGIRSALRGKPWSQENEAAVPVVSADSSPDGMDSTPDAIESAYDEGVVAGTTAARSILEKELEVQMNAEHRRLDALLVNIEDRFQRVHRRLEHSIVRFAIAVAEHIVKREVKLDHEVIVRQIQESLRRVVGVERVKLRVHPQDEALVRERRASVLKGVDSIREILIEPDDKIEPGGCILESDLGNIDARLSTQIKEIEDILLNQEINNVDR